MRTKNSLLNMLTGVVSQIILIILGLVSRKIFINIMGLELLGVNGLFTNIISMLSLAELGIGGAIYYTLYKPLAQEDYPQVRATMQLYGKLYKYIAVAVACIGIALIPFLHLIIKENIDSFYLISIYVCFLTDAVLSYMLAYKKNIICADQKSYIINTVQSGFSILLSITQIVILITTQSFIIYLIAKILFGFSSNLIFHLIANKMYPYLKDKEKIKLNEQAKAELIKNAKALFIVSIATYCIIGTDNILISIFVNVTAVGIYSNYVLIINIINMLINQVFNGLKASLGNLLVKKSIDESYSIFNILYFANFWIISFSSVSLIVLINPFISTWIGDNALFPFYIPIAMVINFYLRLMLLSIETIRAGAGLYSPYPFFKFWALIEGILNLILGVILLSVFHMGIVGVMIATTISTQLAIITVPSTVYKYVFKKPCMEFYKKYFTYLCFTILITAITLWSCSFVNISVNLLELVLKGLICIVLPNGMIVAMYHKTNEFQYIWRLVKEILFKRLIVRGK